jgi:hypothetical protein
MGKALVALLVPLESPESDFVHVEPFHKFLTIEEEIIEFRAIVVIGNLLELKYLIFSTNQCLLNILISEFTLAPFHMRKWGCFENFDDDSLELVQVGQL